MVAEAAGRLARVRRASRAEILKAVRQPTLLIYLGLVILVTGVWGPIQHSIVKGQEEGRQTARDAPAFGAEPVPIPDAGSEDERGANGFLVLASSLRAGVILAAILLLLYSATLLAGEGTAGTFRMVLVRPITRTDLLLAKSGLLFLVVLSFLAAIVLTAWLLGLILGGYGDYVDVRYGQVDYTATELTQLAVVSVSLAPLGLLAVAAFGLLCSSLSDSSSTALTVATLAGVAVLALNLGLSPEASRLNFVTYVDRYFAVLRSFAVGLSDHRFDARLVLPGVVVPAISTLVFLLGARTMFSRRDIHA